MNSDTPLSAGAAGDPGSLDRLTSAFSAIETARQHAYSPQASMNAALEVLGGLDAGDVLVVAVLLAALIAHDLVPAGSEDLQRWSERYLFTLAHRERGS